MFIYDRLYGDLNFPPIIRDALNCPGLLRLRDVRMANVPFFCFPSFAPTSRYEHSLGVCYLAGKFADSTNLEEKDKIELMLSALYHDVATPPFAHAMEEVLNGLYGFDHEEKLRNLIIGKDTGGQRLQVYFGRMIKLHEICQSKKGRSLDLSVLRIADLAAGTHNDRLGSVICSNDIDIDNIDNVIRAASAMGVKESKENIAKIISSSFIFDSNTLCLDEGIISELKEWQKIRSVLYGMIFSSIKDFSLQTMLKDSVELIANVEDDTLRLKETDWLLSDEQFIYERLMKYPATYEIIKSMKLGKTYTCLSYFMIDEIDDLQFLKPIIESIKQIAIENFMGFLSKNERNDHHSRIIINFYIDKRDRSINRPLIFLNQKSYLSNTNNNKRLLIGVFTPSNKIWDERANKKFLLHVSKQFKKVKKIEISKDEYPFIKGVEI